ncbi:MAG: glycosyltransferase family protein, partial [Algiphilus sp.]
TPWKGQSENLEFCAPSNEWFAHDLAACRAVLSTAGNQLIGEALHFGKPILAVPEDAFEQRLNATMVERMGIGMRVAASQLSPSHVDRLLSHEDQFASRTAEYASDGRAEAISTLERYIDELGSSAVAASAGKPRAARSRLSRASLAAAR